MELIARLVLNIHLDIVRATGAVCSTELAELGAVLTSSAIEISKVPME